MIKIKGLYRIIPITILIASILLLSACSFKDNAVNPGDWDYNCTVVYNALGGTINSREIRETFYMKNSYVFKPAGTTNMLIEPVKDGYVLSGWYTAKEDITDKNGNIIGYSFKPEDRWDFDEDRVQDNMTLYARWVPQGKVEYIDVDTKTVMFSKNITTNSPIQELSSAAEKLISKPGYSFFGYFEDSACTITYDFSQYTHQSLIPSNEEIYAMLYEEFPQYFKKVEYVKPDEKSETNTEGDTSDLFINKLGYEIITNNEADRARIRARKNEIYEEAIKNYVENTADKVVYLKYIEGNYARISSSDDIKQGGKFTFSGLDRNGNQVDGYILSKDIDLAGSAVEMAESFSGEIYGNGFSIKNISINVSSKKLDRDTSKTIGLFKKLDGAYIENVKFENTNIKINVNAGIPVTVGALAVEANNTKLKNVEFIGLSIDTGKGDNGQAQYRISDLFVKQRNNKIENITGRDINIKASEWAQVNLSIQSTEEEPAEIEETQAP